jgi:alkylated DNA repair dioxygenase AlkB
MPTPWTLHVDFVADPDPLFRAVRDNVQWTRQMRARQTASMGIPYNYAGASYPEAPFHPAVEPVADDVAHRFGFRATNCLLNRYPTGQHSIGWHADDVSILAPGTGIVIVSLGGIRTLRLRRGTEGDFEYHEIPLPPGSALHMTAAMQATWRHSIRKEPGATERISLTFRKLTHAPPPVDRPRWGETGRTTDPVA